MRVSQPISRFLGAANDARRGPGLNFGNRGDGLGRIPNRVHNRTQYLSLAKRLGDCSGVDRLNYERFSAEKRAKMAAKSEAKPDGMLVYHDNCQAFARLRTENWYRQTQDWHGRRVSWAWVDDAWKAWGLLEELKQTVDLSLGIFGFLSAFEARHVQWIRTAVPYVDDKLFVYFRGIRNFSPKSWSVIPLPQPVIDKGNDKATRRADCDGSVEPTPQIIHFSSIGSRTSDGIGPGEAVEREPRRSVRVCPLSASALRASSDLGRATHGHEPVALGAHLAAGPGSRKPDTPSAALGRPLGLPRATARFGRRDSNLAGAFWLRPISGALALVAALVLAACEADHIGVRATLYRRGHTGIGVAAAPVPASLPLIRQESGRDACVSRAYLQELPLHKRPRSPWSEITTGVFEHVQKVFADIANVEC